MSEHNDNYYQNEHHHHNDDEHQQEQHHDFHEEVRPSAPPTTHDDNGYIVVPPTPQTSIDSSVDNKHTVDQHDLGRALQEIQNSAEAQLRTVIAEADSSTGPVQRSSSSANQNENTKPNTHESVKPECASSSSNPLCPYYFLACDKLSKVEVPPRVRDLLLWTNPKLTGAVFGSVLVLLLSLASFSLFTVVGSLLLVASTVIGAYRFYLMLQFRIKGTYDDTFEKLTSCDLTLPKDKVQRLVQLLESDLNRALNRVKLLLLWDNVWNSSLALTGFYFVYCLGSWFNTLTLLILIHVDLFTLPKIYQVYKQPIDQGIEKVTTIAHETCRQVMAKLPPFLQGKKKAQ